RRDQCRGRGGRIGHSLSARHGPLGGGEGWGKVGDSRVRVETHLTLPIAARWVPSLSLLKGGEGIFSGLVRCLHHASTSAAGASARAVSIAATSAPRTGARPAPLTPDSGSTAAPGRAARASARHF